MEQEKPTNRLFWVDMEMTGLSETKDKILEVAAVVTDLELKELGTYHAVVFQPPEILAGMDEWCQKTHGQSGLTQEVASGISLAQAEKGLVTLVEEHFAEDTRAVLAGNSVGQDRKFIDAYMPTLAAKLHYRIVDVSSFKEIFKARYRITFEKPENHRAKDDISASIAELKHYLSFVSLPKT